MLAFVWTKRNDSDTAFMIEQGESVREKKESLTLKWMEPAAAVAVAVAAALFVCVSSVQ